MKGLLKLFVVSFFSIAFFSFDTLSYTANKVWFEYRPNGIYRVNVNYTVPALKEFREAFVDFTDKKEAESYYWDLVKGADFYLTDKDDRRFVNREPKPEPW